MLNFLHSAVWEANPLSSEIREEAFITKCLKDMTCPHGHTLPKELCEDEQRFLSTEVSTLTFQDDLLPLTLEGYKAFSHLEAVFTDAQIPVMTPARGLCFECSLLAEGKSLTNAKVEETIKTEKVRGQTGFTVVTPRLTMLPRIA